MEKPSDINGKRFFHSNTKSEKKAENSANTGWPRSKSRSKQREIRILKSQNEKTPAEGLTIENSINIRHYNKEIRLNAMDDFYSSSVSTHGQSRLWRHFIRK